LKWKADLRHGVKQTNYSYFQKLLGLREVTDFPDQNWVAPKRISFSGIKVGDYSTWTIGKTKME
jgi:hypothetical protein